MPAPCRFEGVVEYLGWRITMKRKQAGTLVFYRNSDRVHQRAGSSIDIAALHEPGDRLQPFGRFEPRLQYPDPASGLVERRGGPTGIFDHAKPSPGQSAR